MVRPLDDYADGTYDEIHGAPVPLAHRSFACDLCHNPIEDGETRFYCSECDENQGSFDVCERCIGAEDAHDDSHVLKELSPATGLRKTCLHTSLALSLRNRFLCYREKRLLCDVIPAPVGGFSCCWQSFAEIYAQSRELATHLSAALTFGSTVAIFASNSVRWVVADFACVFAGLVSAPVPVSFTGAQAAAALVKSGATAACVGSGCMQRLLDDWPTDGSRWPLSLIVLLNDEDEAVYSSWSDQLAVRGCTLRPWSQVMTNELPPQSWSLIRPRGPHELATVLFTSGSTSGGTPRAVAVQDSVLNREFAHGMFEATIQLGFQPLSYTSQRLLMLSTVSEGGRMALSSGDSLRLFEEFRFVCPTMVQAPPRVWSVLKDNFEADAAAAEQKAPEDRRTQARERVLEQYSDSLGSRITFVSTGSAPSPPGLIDWLSRCFSQCRVSEGYGTTEAGMIAVNGSVLHGVDVRLEDVPELGFTKEDKPLPRGVLWVHTDQVALGYIGELETTQQHFRGGWHCTGDIVEWDMTSRKIRIIARAKNHFKLSQGLYVSPERLETLYSASPLVASVFVFGESSQDYVVAAVLPREHELRAKLAETTTDFETLCRMPEAESVILAELADIGNRAVVQPFEIPRAVLLSSEPWTVENGLLTTSNKVNRAGLVRTFGDKLRTLYSRPLPASSSPTTMQHQQRQDSSSKADDTITAICQIAQEVFGFMPDADAPLKRIGIDSLSAVKLVQALRTRFCTRLGLPSLFRAGATLRTVASEVLSTSPNSSPSLDWELEGSLAPDISRSFVKMPLIKRRGNAVFLTGATGFVGAFLLQEILAAFPPDTRIFCLCREPSSLVAKLQGFGLPAPPLNRVFAVKGDLQLPRLGLSDADHAAICAETGSFFHCAAHVSSLLPYSVLREDNVNGTMSVLRLASMSRGAKLFTLVSSVSAFCPAVDGDVAPDGTRLRLGEFCSQMSGYGASKRVAESLVWEASKVSNLSLLIFRLGTVGSHTSTGACGKGDLVNRIIRTVVKQGCVPALPNAMLSMAPVDHVSRSIVAISLKPLGGIAHTLVNDGPTLAGLSSMLAELRGTPLKEMPFDDWCNSLAGTDLEPFIPAFQSQGFPFPSQAESSQYAHASTSSLLQKLSVPPPPPFTVDTLRHILQFLQT